MENHWLRVKGALLDSSLLGLGRCKRGRRLVVDINYCHHGRGSNATQMERSLARRHRARGASEPGERWRADPLLKI